MGESMPTLRLGDLRVRDFMSPEVVSGTPDEPVSEILGRMKANDIHELPILDRKKLIGVVTLAAIAQRKAPPNAKAKSLVENGPVATPDQDLPAAAERMMSGAHRLLPVVGRDGRPVGILSRTDIVRALADSADIQGLAVQSVMTPQPQCVGEDDGIGHARSVMSGLGERAVPVVDKQRRLVGVVGVKDIAEVLGREERPERDLMPQRQPLDVRVKSIMRPPISVSPDTPLSQALALMTERRISMLVVEKDRDPVGVLTAADLVELAARFREQEGYLVQLSGLEEQPEVYDSLYAVIQKEMLKVAQVVAPRTLTIHVQTYKAEGDRYKYSLRARFATAHRMYHLTHFDWDLHAAMQGLMDILGRQILKEKERRVTERRRRRGSSP